MKKTEWLVSQIKDLLKSFTAENLQMKKKWIAAFVVCVIAVCAIALTFVDNGNGAEESPQDSDGHLHHYANVCTMCGIRKPVLDDAEINNDGWLIKYTGNAAEVVIPEGVNVIWENAFDGCTSLTSVTIPASVKTIVTGAFGEEVDDVLDRLDWRRREDSHARVKTVNYTGTLAQWCAMDNDGLLMHYAEIVTLDGIPNLKDVTELTIPDGVTSIGSCAFSGCSSLACVTIPSSVTSIGYDAFAGCTGLTEVTIPGSVTSIENGAFSWCTNLSSVTIGNGVTSIGDISGSVFTSGTFEGCTSLASVTISKSVTSIGYRAFARCKSLANVTIGNGVTSIGNWAFQECHSLRSLTIPGSVKTIGYEAFGRIGDILMDCENLKTVNYKGTLAQWCAMHNNDGLMHYAETVTLDGIPNLKAVTELTIPDGVTSIENYAFAWCDSLRSVTIPDGVTSIGEGAFVGCNSLRSVTLPGSVTSIANIEYASSDECGAFDCCDNLKTIKYTGTLAQWCTMRHNSWLMDHVETVTLDGIPNLKAMTELTIPDGVESIGDYAFKGCRSLASVTIPDGVTNIGNSAFDECTSLKTVEIPDGVENIGDGAFAGCSGLTSVEIPYGVTRIGHGAFAGTSLMEITIPYSVEWIGNSTFNGCDKLKIVNYSGTKKEWEAIKYFYFMEREAIYNSWSGKKIVCTDGIITQE